MIRMSPNPIIEVLIREKGMQEKTTHRYSEKTHRGEGHVTMEAEFGAMQLQAKECQRLPATIEARKDKEGLSPRAASFTTSCLKFPVLLSV